MRPDPCKDLHILSLLAQKCHVDIPQNQTQVQPKEQKEASVTERRHSSELAVFPMALVYFSKLQGVPHDTPTHLCLPAPELYHQGKQ